VLTQGRELLAGAEALAAAVDRFEAGEGRIDIGTFQNVSTGSCRWPSRAPGALSGLQLALAGRSRQWCEEDVAPDAPGTQQASAGGVLRGGVRPSFLEADWVPTGPSGRPRGRRW
jgi:hypothetical protein